MDEEKKNEVQEELDNQNLEGMEELSNRVTLTDENGNDTEFEFLDIVQCDGKEYVVLLPVENIDDGEVVIFRIEGEGEDEHYIGVETEDEAAKVFEVFKEKTKDEFNFVD